jgi:dihydrofolate reductase
MRKIIAALIISVDGFIEGPNGELDWVETWEDPFDLLPQIDRCILGRGMYPGYEQYWRAILANPEGILPFTGKVASKGEIDYAHFADKTPHIVLSKTLDKVAWKDHADRSRRRRNPKHEAASWQRYVCSRRRHAGFQSDEPGLDR